LPAVDLFTSAAPSPNAAPVTTEFSCYYDAVMTIRISEGVAKRILLLSKICVLHKRALAPIRRVKARYRRGAIMFQIVRLELNGGGSVVTVQLLRPLFEFWEDAMARAELDASRCMGEHGYDAEQGYWWSREADRSYRFMVEAIAPVEVAA
jgi:hypothetical protein